MPLCGSTACGCSLSSSAATSAAINGYYPTIGASGAGTPASPWVMTLDTNWATAVADRLQDSTTYTPTLGGWTIGNGTIDANYVLVGGSLCNVYVLLTTGSTTTFASTVTLTLPFDIGTSPTGLTWLEGSAQVGVSTGLYACRWRWASGTNTMRAMYLATSGTSGSWGNVSSTLPFTWDTAGGEYLMMHGSYIIA